MKKKIIITLLSLTLFASVFGCSSGTSNKGTQETQETAPATETESDLTNKIDYLKVAESEDFKIEGLTSQNDSAALDEIVNIARKDLDDADINAQEKISSGLYFIKNNIDSIGINNEVTEKAIYYGYYIYTYIESNENVKNIAGLSYEARTAYDIAYNTFVYAKYVYRNEDGGSKLEKAKEALSRL